MFARHCARNSESIGIAADDVACNRGQCIYLIAANAHEVIDRCNGVTRSEGSSSASLRPSEESSCKPLMRLIDAAAIASKRGSDFHRKVEYAQAVLDSSCAWYAVIFARDAAASAARRGQSKQPRVAYAQAVFDRPCVPNCVRIAREEEASESSKGP